MDLGLRESLLRRQQTGAKAAPKVLEGSVAVRPSGSGQTAREAVNGDEAAAQEAPMPSSSNAGLQGGPQISGRSAEVATGSVHEADGRGVFTAEQGVLYEEASFGYFAPMILELAMCKCGCRTGAYSATSPVRRLSCTKSSRTCAGSSRRLAAARAPLGPWKIAPP